MSRDLGDRGEAWAVRRLEQLGYRIVERNYRCPLGEIDCVAVHRGAVVFLEVKARATTAYGDPLEAVDRRKRRKLTRLARYYVAEKNLHGAALRFDVVAVRVEDGAPRVDVIENAFDAVD